MSASITLLSVLDGAIQSLESDPLAGKENALYRLRLLRQEVAAVEADRAQLVQTVEQLGNLLAAGSSVAPKDDKLKAAFAPHLSIGLLPNWNGNPRITVAFATSDEAWAFHSALKDAVS